MSAHKKWSIAKSVLRFIGCLAPAFSLPAGFAAAEALGIAEEIGEP